MPYLVTCPNCGSKLKSANPVPAGKSVACPQCKTTFKLSEPAPEMDVPAAAPARPAPTPAPAPRTARSERPAPSRRDEDEDERPRSRRRDDDDDRPRRRRDDDEEDERPRSRRRPADDEEEDRPKSRRRRDEDEDDEDQRLRSRRRPADEDDEDERPRGRRSRDDDEDEDRPKSRKARAAADDEQEDDERPRRRGRGKKKSKKGLALILGGLAVLLLLFAGGGVAFMYFVWDPLGLFGGGSASSDMLAWIPSDTQQIEGMNVESVAKNSKALAAVRNDLTDLEAIGIKAEDMSTVMQAKKGGKGAKAEVTVAKLKTSADKDKISKTAGGTEATANGKKYYKTKNGGGLFFPSDKIVVLTRSENTLTGLLQKEDGKVVINDELKSTVKRADGDMWMAAISSAANLFGDAGGGGPKGGMPGFGPPPAPKNALSTAKLSGDDVTIKMELTFADADTAKKAADQIDAMFKMVKGMMAGMDQMVAKAGGNPAAAKLQGAKKMFETMKVTTSGSVVTITMTAPIDSMEAFGKGGFGI